MKISIHVTILKVYFIKRFGLTKGWKHSKFSMRVYWISNKTKGERKSGFTFNLLPRQTNSVSSCVQRQVFGNRVPEHVSCVLCMSYSRDISFTHQLQLKNSHSTICRGAVISLWGLVQSWFAFCQHPKGRATRIVVNFPTYLQIFKDSLQNYMPHWFVF